ncbi:MAG TPA: hypothetical protein VKA74_17415 [Myxococcota bacterium]|nr:hypothetical protein [Myxococcota bacterium]
MLVASPALAQRPSLLDLQAAVDGLVSPAPPAIAGEILFTTVGGGSATDLRLDLVDLALPVQTIVGFGSFSLDFDPVRVTLPQSASGALLSARLVSGAPQTVRVFVPDVDSPRDPPLEVLILQNAVLQKVEDAALPGRIAVELSYETVTLEWGSTSWGWNLATNSAITGSGCSASASNEAHVDLAGNAATQLQAGEIESTQGLILAPPPALPVLSYTRKPANACALRVTTGLDPIDVSFDRLWSQDEQFAGRQSVETIDFVGVLLRSWTFRIASGEVLEDIELPQLDPTTGVVRGTGVQTLRDFDPTTGAETSAESVLFLDAP